MDAALDRALEVFWRNGFQAASLADLTEAMGLNKPSLYAAFGDKQALYLKALDRYLTLQVVRLAELLDAEPDGQQAVARFLHATAAMLTDPKLPGGCFVINGVADCGAAATPPEIEASLRKTLQGNEAKLRERIERAQREGQLANDADPGSLATLYAVLLAGLGVQAKSGARRARLDAAIDAAMTAWPHPAKAGLRKTR
jgi:AcrR family transcriptional regulator